MPPVKTDGEEVAELLDIYQQACARDAAW